MIELLVIIAIIAILAALLFPVLGQVREQARASDCMSKLHQVWVSASVFRMDEGNYPSTLMAYAEHGVVDTSQPDQCSKTESTGDYFGKKSDNCVVSADAVIKGFLYPEQIKDIQVFKCPDNLTFRRRPDDIRRPGELESVITVAHFPPRPLLWPSGVSYVTDTGTPVEKNCPKDAYGYIDCYLPVPGKPSALDGKPKWYYIWDSFDVGPRVDPSGVVPVLNGQPVFDVHYSVDWTGVRGATDLRVQMKYDNPPNDKTLLTYCTYHSATARADTYTAVNLAGQAKKLPAKLFRDYGAFLYSR